MSDVEKPKMGRPTKLTPELQAAIVADVLAGVPVETACEAAGVGGTTYYDWLRWGKRGTEPYRDFSEAVAHARARAEVTLVKRIVEGDEPGSSANGPSKGAQWLLERTRGKRYAARVNVKVEEELETLLDVVERVCTGKDCGCLETILGALAARAGGEEVAENPGETPGERVH